MLVRDRLPRAFEPELEARFVAHYATMLAGARTLDGSLAIAIVAFSTWVAWIAPWAIPQAVLILVLSAIVVLCAVAWLHQGLPAPGRYRVSTWISAGAVIAAILAIHVLIGCEVGLLVAATSAVAGGYGLLQIRLREGLLLNCTASFAVLAVLVAEGRPVVDVGSAVAFQVLAIFVNLLAGSYLDSTVRRLFMLEVASTEDAARDALTGVLNRRAIQAGATGVRRQQLAEPVAVVVADLDHFKLLNDQCGHDVGDAVLKACVEAWREVLRGDDLLARIGGEEFLVILAGTPASGARAIAERLRRATAGIHLPRLGMPVSASFGVSAWAPDEPLEDAFRRADSALYRAKETGRDRVEMAA